VHGIILAENFNEKDILNATNQLKWRYPARTIAICANAVTSFNPNIHTKIEKEFKATCPETLEFDVAKNFVGLLTSYEYRNSETGLFAIVQDNGSDRYEAYFVNVTFKNGSLEYNLVGGAYLSEDGPGILSVEWSDGARDAARFYDDGTVAFECQNHLNEFVSRADCELSQDFDTMSTGIRLVSDATDVQWQDKDAMANDLGNILTIKLDTFSPELVDFYQFKSFSIGQSGGMFPSGSYGVRDLGFGLLQVINQSNRDTTLGFFDNDNYSYGAIISFWVGGEWIDFLFPKT
jgi:hypothetical protein